MALWGLLSLHVPAWSQSTPGNDELVTTQSSGLGISLRGLCAVTPDIAWCSGTDGAVLRTIDGGQTWQRITIPGVATLDFRDLHAFSDREAVVISVGTPGRIYRTSDGGRQWALCYENPAAGIFFDAMAFWNDQRGLAFSDPLQRRVFLIETRDGGSLWSPLPESAMPFARAGEAGFAASGTCLVVGPAGRAWIGLGGHVESPRTSRVLISKDFGRTWESVTTPLPASESSGIFSMAMIDGKHGVAVGGDYLQPNSSGNNVLTTSDAGASWRVPQGKGPRGYRSAVACVHRGDLTILIAAGPSGMDCSRDFGENWWPLHDLPLHALAFTRDGSAGWGSGANGMIARFNLEALERQVRSR